MCVCGNPGPLAEARPIRTTQMRADAVIVPFDRSRLVLFSPIFQTPLFTQEEKKKQ
jgi:hypothetical protein